MAFAGRDLKLLPQAADVQAMRQFRRSSIISGSENAAVTDQSGTHRPPPAGAAPGNEFHYIQKIRIPIGTMITSRRCILGSCFEFRHIFPHFPCPAFQLKSGLSFFNSLLVQRKPVTKLFDFLGYSLNLTFVVDIRHDIGDV